jgi:hypothetical protein
MNLQQQLKALAVRYESFGGAIVWYMLSFRNVETDVREARLDSICPHWRYTDTRTGEAFSAMPTGLERLIEQAKEHGVKADQIARNPWTIESLWTSVHTNFAWLEPRTVEIEFHCDDATPAEVQAFAAYWQNAPHDDIAERWMLFQKLVSRDVNNAWAEAYNAATGAYADIAAPPKREGGAEDDPLAVSGATTPPPSSVTLASKPTSKPPAKTETD